MQDLGCSLKRCSYARAREYQSLNISVSRNRARATLEKAWAWYKRNKNWGYNRILNVIDDLFDRLPGIVRLFVRSSFYISFKWKECLTGLGMRSSSWGLIMKSIREYLKRKPGLKGRILDRGELKRVARACGLSPQEARSELRKLGFTLTKNDHGLTLWMKQAEWIKSFDADILG